MAGLKKIAVFVVVIALLFFTTVGATAQTIPVKKLLFETITINDGLSQGMVNCILQDRYGFMWFATKDGLNRYDGYHFIVYRHDPSNPASVIMERKKYSSSAFIELELQPGGGYIGIFTK